MESFHGTAFLVGPFLGHLASCGVLEGSKVKKESGCYLTWELHISEKKILHDPVTSSSAFKWLWINGFLEGNRTRQASFPITALNQSRTVGTMAPSPDLALKAQ